jgi:hypothetical protein
MRRTLLTPAALLLIAVLFSPAHAALVGHWAMDEGSGQTVADSSPSGNDGTRGPSGAAEGQDPAWSANVTDGNGRSRGPVLTFDGGNDFVNLAPHVGDYGGLSQGTVAGWFKTPSGSTQVILGASDSGDGSRELRLFVESNRLKYDIRGDSGPDGGQLQSLSNVNDDNWHHAAITVDGTDRAILYLDGRPHVATDEPFFSSVSDLDAMAIGRNVDSGGAQWHFNGSLSDVAIWDQPLTEGQIRGVMAVGPSDGLPKAPVAEDVLADWRFAEKPPGSGTVNTERLLDSSPNGRDAFAGGGANAPDYVYGSPDYANGSALTFTGNRDAAIFRDGFNSFAGGGPPAGSDINFGQNDDFTIQALIRVPDGLSQVGAICSKDVASNSPSWWLRVNGSVLQAIVDDSDPGGIGLVTGSIPINDGEWHHVAFVRDAVMDTVRLYVDYGFDTAALDTTTLGQANGNDIRIGEFNNGGRQFIGDIDFVRISEGALVPDQFLDLPEPGTLTLLAFGGLGLLARRKRRR